jgi:hypothetical protein
VELWSWKGSKREFQKVEQVIKYNREVKIITNEEGSLECGNGNTGDLDKE